MKNTRLLINSAKKICLLSSLLVLSSNYSYSGMDCRSMLGGYIKPLFGSQYVVGGIEVTGAFAGMTDRNIKNGLAIAGLGFNFNDSKHQIYVEGGYKNFYNSKGGPGRKGIDTSGAIGGYEQFPAVDKLKLSFRELFYKYDVPNFKVGIGLQTMKLPDYFLLDERVVGLNSSLSSGNFTYSVTAASVLAQFARYADFCGTRHIYNLTKGRRVDFLGDYFGESNFWAAAVKWVNNPSENSQATTENNSEDDEFEDFTPVEVSKPFLQEVGAIFYNEFGAAFPDYKYYGGLFAGFNLPLGINLKAEALYQYIYKENAVGYFVELSKLFDLGNGFSSLVGAAMVGKIEIDSNTMFYPSYTNLFMGEVMKMDALDLPVAQAFVKFDFPWLDNMYFKTTVAGQTAGSHTKELDLELSARFFNHLKTTLIGGYISSDALKQDTYFGRIEFRVAF